MNMFIIDKLPEKLKNNQILELYKKYYRGNTKARDEIINHQLYLVTDIIKCYFPDEKNKDDLMSVGISSLIDTIDKFNPDKIMTFNMYCKRNILRDLNKYLQNEKKHQMVSFQEIDNQSIDNLYPELKVTIEDEFENKDFLGKILSFLDDREKEILLMFVCESKTSSQVAQKFNLSKSRAQHICNTTLIKLMRSVDKSTYKINEQYLMARLKQILDTKGQRNKL